MHKPDGLFVGLIPDGNRRWAENKRIPSAEGHREGAENIKRLFERARDEGDVSIMSAWALSCANLENRDPEEVNYIFLLVEEFLSDLERNWMDLPENKDIRLVGMGRTDRMENHLYGKNTLDKLNDIATHTRDRTGMVIALCIDYSGRDENYRAIRDWASLRDNHDAPENYVNHLDLPSQGVPYQSVDFIIRTGMKEGDADYFNEQHLAYQDETRFETHTTLLPDYTPDQFSADLEKNRRSIKRRGK